MHQIELSVPVSWMWREQSQSADSKGCYQSDCTQSLYNGTKADGVRFPHQGLLLTTAPWEMCQSIEGKKGTTEKEPLIRYSVDNVGA